MLPRLADRLSAARQRLFVGRAAELTLFATALGAAELPFQVLYVFGPGGVGKTTLLKQFAHLCGETHTPAFYIDGRNVEPSSDTFLTTVQGALHLPSATDPLEHLATTEQRQVVQIDTYETLAPLDNWLREMFLPQLSPQVLVVLAGRQVPSAAWRADPGWQTLIRTVLLRNLSPDEGRLYLDKRQIPADLHGSFLQFTHGHPLALSLFADVVAQRPGTHFQPTDAPDVIKILLEQLIQKVPGPAHRAALEVCALVHLTGEGLLAKVLGIADAHELFEWLRDLSFIEARAGGLFPHDLAREALATDLRWRNPDWYKELHRRIRTYYATRLQHLSGLEQQGIVFDYIFLHRENPVIQPFFEWQASGNTLIDTMRPSDEPELIAMVSHHEGSESARLAQHWLAKQPWGVLVARDQEQRPIGFLAQVALHEASSEDIAADPATQAAWNYLQRHAPLRHGEGATYFRFWMAHDTYQAISPTQSVIGVTMVRHHLTTPGLAFTFLPCADAEFWAPLCAYSDMQRLPEANFEVGGQEYGVFGHDWRAVPPLAWLALLGEREIDTSHQVLPPPKRDAIEVLSQAAFEAAVRNALHHYTRPDLLRHNPLLRSRLVIDQAGANASVSERITRLQALLKDASDTLQTSPRQMKCYRALYHTYLHPAATQEQAAETLQLPFSTYRRHLQTGIKHVAELLWHAETNDLAR